jgi:hypothetical protein
MILRSATAAAGRSFLSFSAATLAASSPAADMTASEKQVMEDYLKRGGGLISIHDTPIRPRRS